MFIWYSAYSVRKLNISLKETVFYYVTYRSINLVKNKIR